MKIAIIGAGISGLGAAWLLRDQHYITVFEKNDYIGGHSRTIDVKTHSGKVPVDTGFIVFNDWNYPNLFGLFDKIGVPYEKSDMSFGVRIGKGFLEYSSYGLFAQKKNFFRPSYWKMIFDILRFNKQAERFLGRDPSFTLRQCLDELKMGDWFRRYYLLAMGAAIWSCPISTILDFPAATYIRFFKNHGLLNINHRPQWYTVKGGSREYVSRLTKDFSDRIYTGISIQKVAAHQNQVKLIDEGGGEHFFDQVIFACHPDDAMEMIKNPGAELASVLSSFTYQENRIVVHSDESFMPSRRKCWASWIYLNDTSLKDKSEVSLSYWMNNLQPLNTSVPVFVTLNPARMPEAALLHDTHIFHHPVFNEAAIRAQGKMDSIQGIDGMWFCGAYQRYGFHEDGLWSAVNVARKMGAAIPWE